MQKNIFHTINYLVKNPRHTLLMLLSYTSRLWPDELFLKIKFRLCLGYRLDLKNPRTFNEKLQWLKLNDKRPIYTKMVDKIEAKKYVAGLIGDDYIIPTIGEYDSPDDIPWNKLPDRFVLKCTHDSGGIVICKDKSKFEKRQAISKLKKAHNRTYYYQNREWPYKNVPHRIICEQYMVDESGYELKDYKFFCFDGEVKALFIATDRGNEKEQTKFDFFDADFNHLPILNGHPNATKPISKPENFELMKDLASKLSKGHCHLRVDFYNIKGKVYFGELTFFHWSGFVPFVPEEWDYKLGSYIHLPIH